MKSKLISILLAVLVVTMIASTGVVAQGEGTPSAKYTAQITELTCLEAAYATDLTIPDWSGWTSILEQDIKVASQKDLIIGVSALSGLYTETNVKSKGTKDTSGAVAAVLLKVTVDDGTGPVIVHPGVPIIFNARVQKLSATLEGFDHGVSFEEIGLLIGTLSANSFNFIVEDLSSGVYTVEVEAACFAGATAQDGSAIAGAVLGLGSVTVEEVRMAKDTNAVPEP